MKNLSLYIIAIALCGVFTMACESYLEEIPQNKLKPSTTDDYDQILNKGYITGQVMPYLDILSDDVDLIASDHVMSGKDYGDAYLSAYMWDSEHETSMSGGDRAFARFYESIFYANVVLENIDKAAGIELDEANVEHTRKNIKGEAYALRAYSYFYLVNLYAKPYKPTDCATDPGIPLTESTAAEDKAYRRNSVKEVYDFIVRDLTEAIRLMEAHPIKKPEKLKFTALSARALLARVYLYMEEWDLAVECAEKVLARNSALFSLHEAGEVLTLANNDNVEWGTDYLSKENENVIFVNGLSELVPALSYVTSFTTFSVNTDLAAQYEPDDVRRLYFMFTFHEETNAGPREKLSYGKNRYMSRNDSYNAGTGSGYTRVIRIEEMYLILAESYAHKAGGIPTALDYLNRLRIEKFRQGKYVKLEAKDFTQPALLEYIWLERRREFCFEGLRWFDLRRTARPAMQRIGYDNQVAVLEKDDPRYVLQIPRRELSVNPAIGVNPR